MIELWHILVVFALGAAPSALLCRVVITLRIVDAPTEARKLQKAPVPTARPRPLHPAAATPARRAWPLMACRW
jgi:hypothetical protein